MNPDQFIGPDVNFNSIIVFDIGLGKIRWSRQLGGYDVWYYACLIPNNPDYPPKTGTLWWSLTRVDLLGLWIGTKETSSGPG